MQKETYRFFCTGCQKFVNTSKCLEWGEKKYCEKCKELFEEEKAKGRIG